HRRKRLRLSGKQNAQRDRQRQHPLAHRDGRDHVIDQVGGGFRHAPGAAGGAKAAPLAGKRDQLLVAALATAQAQKPVRGTGRWLLLKPRPSSWRASTRTTARASIRG